MKKSCIISLFALLSLLSCQKDYIIGGAKSETNKVELSTSDFLKSFNITQKTTRLLERANLISIVNGDVTFIAPSDYAVDRYLRRTNNRRLRLDPKATLWTVEDIPAAELSKLKMYMVKGKFSRDKLTKEGIKLETLNSGDSLRLYIDESTSEPAAAWDGANQPGQGYQYTNFMQTTPEKIFVHFKRGTKWEMSGEARNALGFDNVECDQVYQMYLSNVETTTGIVHIIYVGNYNYSEHYYYHTLFFFGTRADDLL